MILKGERPRRSRIVESGTVASGKGLSSVWYAVGIKQYGTIAFIEDAFTGHIHPATRLTKETKDKSLERA